MYFETYNFNLSSYLNAKNQIKKSSIGGAKQAKKIKEALVKMEPHRDIRIDGEDSHRTTFVIPGKRYKKYLRENHKAAKTPEPDVEKWKNSPTNDEGALANIILNEPIPELKEYKKVGPDFDPKDSHNYTIGIFDIKEMAKKYQFNMVGRYPSHYEKEYSANPNLFNNTITSTRYINEEISLHMHEKLLEYLETFDENGILGMYKRLKNSSSLRNVFNPLYSMRYMNYAIKDSNKEVIYKGFSNSEFLEYEERKYANYQRSMGRYNSFFQKHNTYVPSVSCTTIKLEPLEEEEYYTLYEGQEYAYEVTEDFVTNGNWGIEQILVEEGIGDDPDTYDYNLLSAPNDYSLAIAMRNIKSTVTKSVRGSKIYPEDIEDESIKEKYYADFDGDEKKGFTDEERLAIFIGYLASKYADTNYTYVSSRDSEGGDSYTTVDDNYMYMTIRTLKEHLLRDIAYIKDLDNQTALSLEQIKIEYPNAEYMDVFGQLEEYLNIESSDLGIKRLFFASHILCHVKSHNLRDHGGTEITNIADFKDVKKKLGLSFYRIFEPVVVLGKDQETTYILAYIINVKELLKANPGEMVMALGLAFGLLISHDYPPKKTSWLKKIVMIVINIVLLIVTWGASLALNVIMLAGTILNIAGIITDNQSLMKLGSMLMMVAAIGSSIQAGLTNGMTAQLALTGMQYAIKINTMIEAKKYDKELGRLRNKIGNAKKVTNEMEELTSVYEEQEKVRRFVYEETHPSKYSDVYDYEWNYTYI